MLRVISCTRASSALAAAQIGCQEQHMVPGGWGSLQFRLLLVDSWLISAHILRPFRVSSVGFSLQGPLGRACIGEMIHLCLPSAASISSFWFTLLLLLLLLLWLGAYVCRQGAGAAAAAQLPEPQALLGREWCAAVAATAASLEDLGLAAASEEAYTAVINRCAEQLYPRAW
jgi:hypothetical protein